MKSLKNILGSKNINKSMNSFSEKLDLNSMLIIKGGEADGDGDYWPPIED